MNHTQLGNIAVGAPGSEARIANNLDAFMIEYEKQLTAAVTEHPELYAYPVATVPVVCLRMRKAFERDDYNIDSLAIRRTCKAFGIKHTRQAIKEALRN